MFTRTPIALCISAALFSPALAFAQDTMLPDARADAWIELEGTRNTRDIGGYSTVGGQPVRMGLVFRSDRLSVLTGSDCSILAGLGIRTVVDLRQDSETTSDPDVACVSTFARYEHYPVVPISYTGMIETYIASFTAILHEIADAENLPLLYHCTFGKDRTGITTALIHLLLGVSEENLVYDYLLSNDVGLGVAEPWLREVLDRVESEGGIEAFLDSRGVDAGARSSIRANLLQESSAVGEWDLY